jgi:hypothetical protein
VSRLKLILNGHHEVITKISKIDQHRVLEL